MWSEIVTIQFIQGFMIKSKYLQIKFEIGLIIERTELRKPKKLTTAKNGEIKIFANIEYRLIVLK